MLRQFWNWFLGKQQCQHDWILTFSADTQSAKGKSIETYRCKTCKAIGWAYTPTSEVK